MDSNEIFIEAVAAIMKAIGFSYAFWFLVVVITATSLWELWQAHKYRKSLPEKIAAEILKVTS